MKRILHITIALLLLAVAGQNAWAETKTVTYTITNISKYGDGGEQITFTPSNNGFGTSTGSKVATINNLQSTNGFDVTLDDGVTLRLSRDNGLMQFIHNNNSTQYGILINTTGNQHVRFTVSCSNYYILHIKLAQLDGTALEGTGNPAPNPSGSLDLDVDIDKATNNDSKYQALVTQNTNFGQLTITLSDKPRLWGQADGADGSAEHPFLISNTAGLDSLAARVNRGVSTYSGKHFLQTENLTYDGTENNFTAIGNKDHAFSGHYDGGEKTISGINISKTGTDTNADSYLGIFGYVDGGIIEKLALAGSTIVGFKYVGGIVGYLKGTVQNCRVENNVTVSTGGQNSGNQDFGGVVGRFESGTVQGCVCGASVIRTSGSLSFCGGIVGSSGGTLRSNVYFGTSVYGINQRECGAILGYGYFSYNNYYTATSGVPKGKGTNMSNIDTPPSYEGSTNSNANASPAKLLTLGEHVAIDGDVVEYPFSGLTDLGGMALRYNDGNSVRIFTHTRQTVTFRYEGEVPDGKSVAFRHCESNRVRPISGTTWTIQGSGNHSFYDNYDAFAIYATLVSDQVTITGKPALGGYWATFYSSASYYLPEGTVAYIMESNGQLHPLAANNNHGALDGKRFLGCVAVVLFSDKESITLTRSNEKWDEDVLQYENILLGSDDPVPVVSGLVDGKTPYVLGVVEGVFGFHAFTGTEIPANKAYFLKSDN